jgi:hypothetical protein
MGLAYLLGSSDSQPAATSDASSLAARPAFDAAPPDAALADAALPDVALPDAAPPDAKPVSVRRKRIDAAPRRAANATLRVGTTPWATVKVIGRSEGCHETPCQIKLPAGTYRIRMVNPASGLSSTISVTLKADEVTQVKEVLRPPTR